ncbi:MAG: AAA family ATPase [Actinomycetota bacterium]
MEVRVLDLLSISVGGTVPKLSPVERNLVALLAAAGPDGLDTERLADGLWVDRLPATWSASLRNSISRLNAKFATLHPDGAKLISERSPVRRLELDREAVDLWRLLDWAGDPTRADEPALLVGTPFPGCELPPLLRSVTEQVVAARQDVVARWEAEGDALPNQVLAAVRRLCEDDPFNQSFIFAAVRLHLVSDHRDGARKLIADAEAELSDIGVPLSEELAAARDELDQGAAAVTRTGTVPVSTPPLRSAVIERLAQRPMAGRDRLMAELLDGLADRRGPGLILHGNPGIGKTRLAAEVARRLEESGFHTAYVVADQHTFGSLQPFLDSFRGLRDVVKPHLDRLNQPEIHSRSRTEMIEYFERAYAGRPLCLVVDDVQWFDEQSRALLLSLCRASLDIEVYLIAAGRGSDRSSAWPGWIDDLGRAGLMDVRVRALDRDAMVELIGARLPEASRVRASQLAEGLLELSSGIPEVADWLLQRVDPDTLEIATDEVDGTGYSAVVNALEDEVRDCGAVAALLGIRFNVTDLCRLVDMAEVEAGRHVGVLVDQGLLLELPMPDEYRFLHVLAAEALSRTLSPQRQSELHARAFTLFNDPHRQAWHGSRSVPVTAPADAAAALVSSARIRFAEGDFPSASRNIEQAAALSAQTVTLEDEVLSLEALERGGVRATAKRALVTRSAIDQGDLRTAVAAATSGLPDTEALEGDLDRVAALRMIEPAHLEPPDRIHLKVQLSRQLLFAGRIEEAQKLADEAYAEAETPDDLARSWLAAQLPGGLGSTSTNPRQHAWFDRLRSRQLIAAVNQATIINTIRAGQSRSAYRDIVDHVAMTRDNGFTQLSWFAKMYQATALTDQGERDTAMSIAGEAYRLGLRAGLRIAGGTFETQHFVWKFHEGTHGEFHELMNPRGPSDITGNIIFAAASAASFHAHGIDTGDDRALQQASELVEIVGRQAESSAFDTAVIGMVADVIAANGSLDLIRWATERLADRHGEFLLLASAAANLGPVEGISARLVTDRSERFDLFRVAIDIADANGLALWQVLGRLNLAHALGPDDDATPGLLTEAREAAATPWLARIVAAGPNRFRG